MRCCLIALPMLAGALLGPGASEARWRSEMAQLYTPQEQEWFGKQLIPGTSTRCCSTADGTFALEDIRYDAKGIGHYWTKFHTKSHDDETGTAWGEQETEWIEVPDDRVIREPNRHGSPAVWWYFENGEPKIKCYAPGGGV